jgi:RHS repeat-associated protein
VAFTYTLSATSANAVQTQKLGPNGNQVTSYQLYDGRLRLRQTQTPATADTGGRVIADAAYDGRGLTVKASTFFNSSAPAGTLASFADTDVATQHRYTFDNLGRQNVDALWSTNSLVSQMSTGYDGDHTNVTTPTGGTATTTFFDARGYTTELDQYLGSTPTGAYQTTSYGYDRLGRQTTVTDPGGNTWTTTYDLRGRVTAKSDPDTGNATMTYDDNGQLLTSTDSRGITLTNVYDNLGRRTAEWQGPVTTGTKLVDSTFDTLAKGQLTSSNRYTSGGTYTTAVTGYDDAYRPLGTTVTIPASEGFSPNSWTTSQTYNVDGSVHTTTLPAAGGLGQETVMTLYDDTGVRRAMGGLDTYVSRAIYDGLGRQVEVDLGADSGVHLAAGYDPATGRLTQTVAGTGGTANQPGTWTNLLTVGYQYDPAGNVTGKTNTESDASTNRECFNYDGLRQLTQAWTTTAAACQATPSQGVVGGPDPYWQTYTYNPIGNRTSQVNHAATGDTTNTYTYPTGHTQPHTLTSIAITGPSTGTSSYGYDPSGNTTTRNMAGKPGQTLTWDPEGHLATLNASGDTTSYLYDAGGNRLIAKDNTGETVYIGPTEIHRTTSGTVTCTRYYSYNGKTIAVRTDPGNLNWQAVDNHGTAELTINATTKAVASRLRTDPFGNPRNTNPWPSTHGFVNGSTDPTGLTHLGAREYDPTTGRFISADPIFQSGDPQQMGGFSYAANNPTTSSDPTGLSTKPCPDGDCTPDAPGYGGPVYAPPVDTGCSSGSASACDNGGGSAGSPPSSGTPGAGSGKPSQSQPKDDKQKSAAKDVEKQIGFWSGKISMLLGFVPSFLCGACCTPLANFRRYFGRGVRSCRSMGRRSSCGGWCDRWRLGRQGCDEDPGEYARQIWREGDIPCATLQGRRQSCPASPEVCTGLTSSAL